MSSSKISAAAALLALGLAASCTVEDKGDYTFDDNPDRGGGNQGGSAGKGGKGGSTAASGGDSGAGGESTGGTAGKGGKGGSAGTSGGAGESGAAGGSSEDPCDPNPCEHGDCSVDGDGYKCSCEDGYEGPTCETNKDDCTPEPCENGGSCTDLVDDYKCDCTQTGGYTGKDCQIPPGATCEDEPCHHGGICVSVSGGGFRCDCDGTGYEGDTCETDIDECRRGLDNCDPVATCDDRDGTFTCTCPLYYQDLNRDGTRCQPAYSTCAALHLAYPEAPTDWYPIAYGFETAEDLAFCDMSFNGGGWTNISFPANTIALENDNTIYCAAGMMFTSNSITCYAPYANASYDMPLYEDRCDGQDLSAQYLLDEVAPLLGHQYSMSLGFPSMQQAYDMNYPGSAGPYYYEYCYVDGQWVANTDPLCERYGGSNPNGPCVPSFITFSF